MTNAMDTIHSSLLPDGLFSKVAHTGRILVPWKSPSVDFTLGMGVTTDLELLCQADP